MTIFKCQDGAMTDLTRSLSRLVIGKNPHHSTFSVMRSSRTLMTTCKHFQVSWCCYDLVLEAIFLLTPNRLLDIVFLKNVNDRWDDDIVKPVLMMTWFTAHWVFLSRCFVGVPPCFTSHRHSKQTFALRLFLTDFDEYFVKVSSRIVSEGHPSQRTSMKGQRDTLPNPKNCVSLCRTKTKSIPHWIPRWPKVFLFFREEFLFVSPGLTIFWPVLWCRVVQKLKNLESGVSDAPLVVGLWWCVNAQQRDGIMHWDRCRPLRVGVTTWSQFSLVHISLRIQNGKRRTRTFCGSHSAHTHQILHKSHRLITQQWEWKWQTHLSNWTTCHICFSCCSHSSQCHCPSSPFFPCGRCSCCES